MDYKNKLDSQFVWAVHPRAYGEHCHFMLKLLVYAGSSPCLRGTFPILPYFNACVRFIPVLTGNISSLSSLISSLAVHPRAYGEHLIKLILISCANGSSPCLRGTLTTLFLVRLPLRFIPVLTGNISFCAELNAGPTVHPRAYGEH